MLNKENNVSASSTAMLLLIFLNAFILKIAFIENDKWYATLVITLPLLFVAVMARKHKKHTSLTYSPTKIKMIDEKKTNSDEQLYEQGSNEKDIELQN